VRVRFPREIPRLPGGKVVTPSSKLGGRNDRESSILSGGTIGYNSGDLMNAAVLVLDIGMRPLRVESWQKVVSDLFLGKVEVVEWKYHSRDRSVRSVSGPYPLPSVVRVLTNFRRDRVRVKFSRINIYTRDKFACQYCGDCLPSEDLTFDHVIPRSRGGRTSWENIVTACVPCNKLKADRTPSEVGMKLLRQPRKPAYLPLVTVKMNTKSVPIEWRPYWTAVIES
jgi:5-methylcytosine-specific restriction endonuclease McrA